MRSNHARLIEEEGFAAVAVEGDWPDGIACTASSQATEMTRSNPGNPSTPSADFATFPHGVAQHGRARICRVATQTQPATRPFVGFFDLDLYSLYASAREVLHYLDKNDPVAAARARFRISYFDQFGEDSQAYGYSAGFGMTESCDQAVIDQLLEMRRRMTPSANTDRKPLERELFSTRENAEVFRDAERYYRTMFGGRVSSWNLRDRHMADTLDLILDHLGRDSKVIIWAHNSHLGDARATEIGHAGELNLGQLVRERYSDAAFLFGLTTYSGEVTATSNWDEPHTE